MLLLLLQQNGQFLSGDVVVFEVGNDVVEVVVDPLLTLLHIIDLLLVKAVQGGIVGLLQLALNLTTLARPIPDLPTFKLLR